MGKNGAQRAQHAAVLLGAGAVAGAAAPALVLVVPRVYFASALSTIVLSLTLAAGIPLARDAQGKHREVVAWAALAGCAALSGVSLGIALEKTIEGGSTLGLAALPTAVLVLAAPALGAAMGAASALAYGALDRVAMERAAGA